MVMYLVCFFSDGSEGMLHSYEDSTIQCYDQGVILKRTVRNPSRVWSGWFSNNLRLFFENSILWLGVEKKVLE